MSRNQHVLSNTVLRNHGTVSWTGGKFYLQGNTTVVNESDGLWHAQADVDFNSSACGAPTFTNAGMLRKSAGTGAFLLQGCVTYANTGTVELQTGTLSVPGTLTTSGHLTVAAGTTFYLANVTLQSGSTFSGTGTLYMNGTTTVTGDVTLTVPTCSRPP